MNRITESLFQKSFAECSAEELRQLTAQYPYFAPAHFLLLKKYDPTTEEYRRQYGKAQLYFHDPVSFEFFLNRPEKSAVLGSDPVPAVEEETVTSAHTEAAEVATKPFTPTSLEEHEVGMVEEGEAPELPDAAPGDETDAAPAPPLPGISSINLKAPAEGSLSFEPYHAVDYFASQGIKLSRDEVGTDKFGKQLKSFTDWLKTMKRIEPEATTQLDAKSEARVENLADHSVKEAEIVTESMAEVWVKQGNKRKATEIYRKLSLLHPAKSAYFADKINSLNA